jgi:hypothetical protein
MAVQIGGVVWRAKARKLATAVKSVQAGFSTNTGMGLRAAMAKS